MNIVLSFDNRNQAIEPIGFRSCIQSVADFFNATYSDNIRINIDVGYGFVGHTNTVPSLGNSSTPAFIGLSYTQLRNGLSGDRTTADDQTAFASLPSNDPFNLGNGWTMARAVSKALNMGFVPNPTTDTGNDGSIGIGTGSTYDTNRSDGISPGTYDLFGVFAHELTECLGRGLNEIGNAVATGGPHIEDLFHYSDAVGHPRTMSGTTLGYFSINGGATNLGSYNTSVNGDFGDWADPMHSFFSSNYRGNDSFNAFGSTGVLNAVSEPDLLKMDILGYNRVTLQSFASQSFASPSLQLSAFGTNAGGWSSDDTYPRELADVNGDGMADIVGFGAAGVWVSLATGGGHFAPSTFELPFFGPNAGGWSSNDTYPREVADVNGDGIADIVGFGSAGVYRSLATGGGHFAAPTFELAAFGVGAGGWSSDDTYPRELADVNGDGMADIVGFGQAGVWVSLGARAAGGGHFAAPEFELAAFGVGAGGWSSDNTYPRELADVNGDGMADIVGFGQAGVWVSLATGGRHFAAPTFELAAFGVGAGGWSSDDTYPRELADVNGDGMADIVGFGQAGVWVSLATGGGHFASPTFQLSAFGPNAGGWSSDDTFPREVGDITGDGKADIVGFGSSGVWSTVSALSASTMAAAGASPSNTMIGSAGDDTLKAFNGINDILTGGPGNDTFVIATGGAADTITDFTPGSDLIDLSNVHGVHNYDDVHALMHTHGSDVVIDFGSGDSLTIQTTTIAILDAHPHDFILV
jgi:hypothetical protein